MIRKTRSAWFGVFIVMVFGAGVGTGLLLGQYLKPISAASTLGGGAQPPAPRVFVEILAKQLDLTDDQQRELETSLVARRQKIGAFGDDIRKRIEDQRAGTFAEIERILRPDQRPRFDALMERMRGRERRFGSEAFPPLPLR